MDMNAAEYHMEEMRVLCELLEAEVSGRPFDRAEARRLAQTLASKHPEIGQTMLLMCERIKTGEKRN
jgi:hypothetical protein